MHGSAIEQHANDISRLNEQIYDAREVNMHCQHNLVDAIQYEKEKLQQQIDKLDAAPAASLDGIEQRIRTFESIEQHLNAAQSALQPMPEPQP
jgi:DNA repair exonuclease SbcCD ATPase subunit